MTFTSLSSGYSRPPMPKTRDWDARARDGGRGGGDGEGHNTARDPIYSNAMYPVLSEC
jgi:hypothetical protein